MYSKCHFKTLILVVIIQNNNDNDMICLVWFNIYFTKLYSSVRFCFIFFLYTKYGLLRMDYFMQYTQVYFRFISILMIYLVNSIINNIIIYIRNITNLTQFLLTFFFVCIRGLHIVSLIIRWARREVMTIHCKKREFYFFYVSMNLCEFI